MTGRLRVSSDPRTSRRRGILAAVLLVPVMVAAGCGGSGPESGPDDDPLAGKIKSNRYQAVILDNDRVYFGKLSYVGGTDGTDWYQLRDAHFIREKTDLKAKTASQQVAPVAEELQQPDDTILLNAEHIIQVQNLSATSRVTTAINTLS